MRTPVTMSKTMRTKPLPRAMAVRAPMMAPVTLQAAMSRPSVHSTEPLIPKTISEAALVPTLTILAVADACRKV